MYTGYQLHRRLTPHRRHIWTIIIIVLIVATVGSITALFLRGFRFKDFTAQLNQQEVSTPEMKVWLLETTGYRDKMDAYKGGIAAAVHGAGVYVLPQDNKWTWIAGVYQDKKDAENVLNQNWLPAETTIKFYQITSKKFRVTREARQSCQHILSSVKKIFNFLQDLRIAVSNQATTGQIQHALITEYNAIKSEAEKLQTLNTDAQDNFIATLIYTANQNILGLQEIICADANIRPNMATVNTALLMTIFSLDNF